MASELYTMNPVKRGKRKKSKVKSKSRKRARRVAPVLVAPIGRRKRRRASTTQFVRRRRRKSAKLFGGGGGKKLSLASFMESAKNGAINGLGAFATDIAMGFVRPMLPTALGFGPARHLTRVGIGLVLSQFANKINPRFANAIAVGTATVAGYDFAKEYIQPMLPAGVVLGEYTNMGAYTTSNLPNLGYQSSGAVPQSTMGAASESAYYNTYN